MITPRRPYDLEADGKARPGKARRHRGRGRTGKIEGQGARLGGTRGGAGAFGVDQHERVQMRLQVLGAFECGIDDFDWRKRGWNPQSPGSNYFSPDRFQDALLAALHWSDEYVWIYTEKPRFWARDGKPVELPAAYVDCIWRARKEYCVN